MTEATKNRTRDLTSAAALMLTAAAAVLLQGCGISTSKEAVTSPVPVAAVSNAQGIMMGGQQAVAGVTAQLYVVGSSYGGAASKLGASFTSTPSGNFTVPSFTCPLPGSLVFLVGTGGTPIGGSANPNLAMMAGLGACSAVGSSFITVNEVTTVATVYALAGFMTGPTNIGAPASNTVGIANAFAAINKVVNIATGTASGPALPAGAILPITEINALGNILQNCVNSPGGSAADSTDGFTNGTPCGKLFFLTKNSSTTPTDTITATMLLAQNPALGGAAVTPTYVARLNDLQASSPAFSPALSVNSPPTDFTIGISYTSPLLNSPQSIAVDAVGNIFVASTGDGRLTELSNTGATLSSSSTFTTGLTTPYGLAIDQQGYIWVTGANASGGLARVDPSGNNSLNSTFAGLALNTPKGVAIDGAGNVWIANSGMNAAGKFVYVSPGSFTLTNYTVGGISAPASIAVNAK